LPAGPSLTSLDGSNQIAVLNALVPPEGPKAIFTTLDFTSASQAIVDFTLATAQGKITCIQSIWVDNSLNSQPLIFTVQGTGQVITCPAYAQGSVPVIAANRPKFNVATVGDLVVNVIWLNVPLPANLWFPAQGASTFASAAAVTSITTGGDAQTVWAAGSVPLGGAVIINPVNATESLFVNIVQAAEDASPATDGSSVELTEGQDFIIPPGFQGGVSVNAATTGHHFIAYGLS
jgi:hypothetical protein